MDTERRAAIPRHETLPTAPIQKALGRQPEGDTTDEPRFKRFRDEARLQQRLTGEPGILPVVDAHFPMQPGGKDRAWLATALATRIDRALRQADLPTVVSAVGNIARTLAGLHQRGISHRDLKPSNLYQHNGEWAVGDFGLASFPGKEALTATGEQLGPAHYIAPEMMSGENVKRADGKG